MRVYHFVNKEYGIQDLQKRRLKIARLHELNDPFELFGVEFSNEDIRSAFHKMKTELTKKRGLICFSKSWHNPVQWSHYADKHQGLCFGFDIPDHHLGEVNYSRKRLVIDAERLKNPGNITFSFAKRFLFTKYSHWSYENEVRGFISLDKETEEKGLYFLDFSDSLKLKEVIVGSESDITRQEISDSLSGYNINVNCFKARLAFKSFRVVRQRKESLWL
ncbi:DUF2971 domain-containing protein [Simiduia litorea]|uniref:DUF2971 domain-containing protein n=1 Tax=Simiduia litorea TaxID=1435348 RepID=UPI0036F4374A